MKRLLLLLLFLSPIFSKAQTSVYHPFPEDSAKWCAETCDGGSLTLDNYHSTCQIIGKTLINDNWYSRMIRYEKYCQGAPINCVCYHQMWEAIDTLYIRQDSALKKVWLYNAPTNSDTIFLDFDLHVGDSLTPDKEYWAGLWPYSVVTSIDSILIDGQYRTKYNYGDILDPGCYNSMVEGIGPLHGLFYKPGNCFEYFANLRYFEENNHFVYCDICSGDSIWGQTFCYDFSLGVAEISDNPLTISPNPTHSSFTINHGGELKIYDAMGGMVMQQTIVNPKSEIINLTLPAGIYFVRLRDGGAVYTQKLVIE